MAKSKNTISVNLSKQELIQMRKIAGIRMASDEHILKAFITKILNL